MNSILSREGRPAVHIQRVRIAGLVMAALIASAVDRAAGAWSDDFDSYQNGSGILNQGAWAGWHNVQNDDTVVTDEQAASAPHALKMGGPAVVDLIPQFEGATSEIWHLDVNTYVPTGSNSKSSDIGFLARHTGFQGAPDTQWFGPFTLNMESGLANGTVPIVRDQWIPMRTVFDIDAQSYDIYYDGKLAKSGTFTNFDKAVVGLDAWTPEGASTLYYDDFSMRPAVPEASAAPSLAVRANGDDLVFTWNSQDGKLYNLRSTADPSSATPADWPIHPGGADLAATSPENMLTVPRPAEATRFFVVEVFDPPPVVLFAENFDAAAALPAGWATGAQVPPDTGSTLWQVGSPSAVGPATAQSGPNCAATNLTAHYGENTEIYLRTPAIDLTTASAATLHFYQFVDTEQDFDFGKVSVLDAADDSELGVIEMAIDGEGATGWEEFAREIPGAALGKSVKIEFRFQSDDFDADPLAGWYIDEVTVTVP